MYETDATFNTNSLKLPLSVMVGIDNTGATFPMAYCFITSESAASFKWIAEQLTELVFYDCPEPDLIIGDFSIKGLELQLQLKPLQILLQPIQIVSLLLSRGVGTFLMLLK